MTREERAYEGLCNILNAFRRKDDIIPVKTLKVLKTDCDKLDSINDQDHKEE